MSSSEAQTKVLQAVTAMHRCSVTGAGFSEGMSQPSRPHPGQAVIWASLTISSQVIENSLSCRAAGDSVCGSFSLSCGKMWLQVVSLFFCFLINVCSKCLDLSLLFICQTYMLTDVYFIHFCSDFSLFFRQTCFPILLVSFRSFCSLCFSNSRWESLVRQW